MLPKKFFTYRIPEELALTEIKTVIHAILTNPFSPCKPTDMQKIGFTSFIKGDNKNLIIMSKSGELDALDASNIDVQKHNLFIEQAAGWACKVKWQRKNIQKRDINYQFDLLLEAYEKQFKGFELTPDREASIKKQALERALKFAVPMDTDYIIICDYKNRRLFIMNANIKQADEITSFLRRKFEGLPVQFWMAGLDDKRMSIGELLMKATENQIEGLVLGDDVSFVIPAEQATDTPRKILKKNHHSEIFHAIENGWKPTKCEMLIESNDTRFTLDKDGNISSVKYPKIASNLDVTKGEDGYELALQLLNIKTSISVANAIHEILLS